MLPRESWCRFTVLLGSHTLISKLFPLRIEQFHRWGNGVMHPWMFAFTHSLSWPVYDHVPAGNGSVEGSLGIIGSGPRRDASPRLHLQHHFGHRLNTVLPRMALFLPDDGVLNQR